MSEHDIYMRLALEEAEKAFAADEVPVGAVIRLKEEVIARAYDERHHSGDPTAHAELLAIRRAAARLGDWRLEHCILYSTLEPCPMCAGALILSRVECLVYGAPNYKSGAVVSRCRLLDVSGFNHKVKVVPSILADESAELLSRFFDQKRAAP